MATQNERAEHASKNPGQAIRAADIAKKGDPTKGSKSFDKIPSGPVTATPLTTDVGSATSKMSKHVQHAGPKEMPVENANPAMQAPLK